MANSSPDSFFEFVIWILLFVNQNPGTFVLVILGACAVLWVWSKRNGSKD